MEDIKIEKTKQTFGVCFNAGTGVLEMTGSSYPENAIDFFSPLYQYVKQYIAEIGKDLTLNLRIEYLNSSSSKCVLSLLEILENYHKTGKTVKVNWYYDANDEDMMETGEEFREDFLMPFELLSA